MNDKPTESELLKDPNKVLDDAYNKGVDDSIKTIDELWNLDDSRKVLLESIISSLSKLKSNGNQ